RKQVRRFSILPTHGPQHRLSATWPTPSGFSATVPCGSRAPTRRHWRALTRTRTNDSLNTSDYGCDVSPPRLKLSDVHTCAYSRICQRMLCCGAASPTETRLVYARLLA